MILSCTAYGTAKVRQAARPRGQLRSPTQPAPSNAGAHSATYLCRTRESRMALASSRLMIMPSPCEPRRSQRVHVRNAFGHASVATQKAPFLRTATPLRLSGHLANPPTPTCSSADLSWRFACRCRICSPTANRRIRGKRAPIHGQRQADLSLTGREYLTSSTLEKTATVCSSLKATK